MIKTEYGIRLLNLVLRFGTLTFKSSLIFFLVLMLPPAEVGGYGIFVATLMYALYPIGLEFYSYANRAIVSAEIDKKSLIIKNQFFLYFLLFVLMLPLYYGIFLFDLISIDWMVYFFLILFLENINQELMRLFIISSNQIGASINLFVRQGLWCVLVVSIMYFDEDYRNLNFIFKGWLLGELFCFAYSLVVLKKYKFSFRNKKIDLAWIKKGIFLAMPLFFAKISFNLLTTLDKYWFSSLTNDALLGAYVFFMAISASLISFLDAGIFSFAYPQLIKLYKNSEYESFYKKSKMMFFQTISFSLFFLFVAYIFSIYFLKMFSNGDYFQETDLLYFLIFATVLNGFGFCANYMLYAMGEDFKILLGNLVGVALFLVVGVAASLFTSYFAVPFALLSAFLGIFLTKLLFVRNKFVKINFK